MRRRIFLITTLITAAISSINSSMDCGGFVVLSSREQGSISSPGYPSGYPPTVHCIWLIEAKAKEIIDLVIDDINTTDASGGCTDALEIRAGNSSADLLFSGCAAAGVAVASPSRWLWLRFFSDQVDQNSGFIVSYSARIATNDIDKTIPYEFLRCSVTSFRCANKECISTAYLCDGDNDCGCHGGCDEDRDLCNIPKTSVGIFILIVIAVILYENYASNTKRQREKRLALIRKTTTRATSNQLHSVGVNASSLCKRLLDSNSVFWFYRRTSRMWWKLLD
ncbi:hypothetical protein CAPTEDRAFT_201947 [Capitella teleta]|uniref:CUB domain-containing protein n=1 Tax=Capitella teleta TaxID=283909 RepID=R7TCC3_CAPTE|nr:hypothetical protein CAPTEDRAFT_201947 [Capitella teleta]|eukprot:ELT91368.1 hypothetical protein CAPTEDRAFT_201947 [Capitella teleta]